MQVHILKQGDAVWHAHRAGHRNASDAPAMIGCSPYKTRTQLLHETHTGVSPEVDAGTQHRFDNGHRFEGLALSLAEDIVGEDLSPVVGTKGKLSASFDGLSMDGKTAFEHKTLNDALRAALMSSDPAGNLPLAYRVQMEQQLMVSGAERALFMASKWDDEDELIEELHCWYEPDAELRAAIIAGWAQFEQDLASYTPTEKVVSAVGAAITALPAVSVQVTGSIVIKDNFKAFEVALKDFIEHRLIRKPETDQDFADLDTQIKALKGAEFALDALEVQMLSQVEAVDLAKRTKDMLLKMARDNRLMAEKLLAARKEQIKVEQVQRGQKSLSEHIEALNNRLGKNYMPAISADFGNAVKGKRTVSSLQDAVATTLANAKIEASAVADRIQFNLSTLRDLAAAHTFLFSDTVHIVQKAPDDLTLLVKARIAEHRAAEAAKEEWTRLRIRAEEQAKAEAAAREKVALEVAAALQIEREKAAEDKRLVDIAARQNAPQIIQEIIQAAPAVEYIAVPATQTIAPAANVVPMRAAAPAVAAIPGTPPTLKLGQIGERLGFLVTAVFLCTLGFEPAACDKNAVLFHESDFPFICAALVAHIESVQTQRAA